ncbi:DUF3352 domain-containing protein [Cyanobacterium stanieri LEGE 03274]|uniref:DUF3352 domain-containing protein n=1 Tax=Cyanobacterium stanieri LEGE 03274 TaxID=1828756 RepID=A0ABR9V5T3_9CHRO|nr:DUF3352 domain-containing protein [Cyanobacterium stanieri]MBE9222199.1 DUF3352 domain-containing protein [Cyanobacterium stanieri LEGE 03274]
MTVQKKNKLGIGCLGISLLILVGGGLGYYFGRRMLLGEELTPLRGAQVIPADAVATGFISTDINDWQQLEQFDTFNAQQVIEETWQQWQDELAQGETPINYQEDIEPWLGGLMIAFLPNVEDISEPNISVVAGIKNKLKARDFLNKMKDNPEMEITEGEYQNITTYQLTTPDNPQGIWFTFFGSQLVMGNGETVIQQVIDTYRGAESVAQVKQANEATNQKLTESNPLFQVYITDYSYFIDDVLLESFELPESIEIPVIETTATTLNIQDHGLNLSTVVGLSQPLPSEINVTTTHGLVNNISDEVIFMVDGIALKNIWQQVELNRQLIPELDEAISLLESFTQNALNLNLQDDIFAWLDGEFAFGLSLNENNSFADTGFKGLFLMETGDRTLGETTLNKLEEIASFDQFLTIEKEENNGIPTTKWITPEGQLLSYGWFENNKLFLNLSQEENIDNTINNNSPLTNSQNYTQTTQTLPQNNFGYVYFDIEKTVNILNEFDPTLFENAPPESQQIINALKGIAITSSSNDPNTSQIDINISLQKK